MASSSQAKRRRKTMLADLYLPVECWECVVTFLIDHNRCMESLCVVSKQFLSITNRLRFSLTMCDQTLPFLPLFFSRFTNLTSLNLTCLNLTRFPGNLNGLLCQISCFPLKLTSLNLSSHSNIPANGLLSLSKKITSLTSLTCSNMSNIKGTDIFLISDCFPLLEVLDLRNPLYCKYEEVEPLLLKLFKLRKVNLSGHRYIDDKLIFHMFKNCKFLEEAIMLICLGITFDGMASALRERPRLRSLSFSNVYLAFGTSITSHFIATLVSLKSLTCLDLTYSNISNESLCSFANEGLPLTRLCLGSCKGYSYDGIFFFLSKYRHIQHLDLQFTIFLNDQHVVELSLFLRDLVSINLSHCFELTVLAFFALVKNCPSLSDIKMELNNFGRKSLESSKSLMDFTPRPQLKYLRLANNQWLTDENIIMFASISPNLQLLDLCGCGGIGEGIAPVLWMCCNIRHLNLSFCSKVKLLEMNFEVPKLEVLNLSYTNVDDETLYVISKSCGGLLQLTLKGCTNVTKKGMEHVVENCRQLKLIK